MKPGPVEMILMCTLLVVLLPAVYLIARIRAPEEAGRKLLHEERCGGFIRWTRYTPPFVRVAVYEDCFTVSAGGKARTIFYSSAEMTVTEDSDGAEIRIFPREGKRFRLYVDKGSRMTTLLKQYFAAQVASRSPDEPRSA